MKEEYGLFVWPCSIVLAEYVWQQRLRFSGSSVVEVKKFEQSISLNTYCEIELHFLFVLWFIILIGNCKFWVFLAWRRNLLAWFGCCESGC